MKLRNTLLGAGLGLVAGWATALSLGDARGTVVLGQPLDLVFDVQMDAGADAAASCVSADVYAGDAQIPASRVRVVAAAGEGRVRVVTSAPIDEPLASVVLHAGCGGAVSRRYDFFPQLPSATESAARAGSAAIPAPAVPQPQSPAAASAQEATPAPTRAAPRRAAGEAGALPAARSRSGARSLAPAATARSAVSGKPRLDLEPLGGELLQDAPLALRLTPALGSQPVDGASAQRADAAANWKALNAQPQQAGADEKRLQAVENDVRALRNAAGRDRATIADLQAQLAQARDERYGNPVVYALAALLLLCMAGTGFLLLRRRGSDRRAPWWHKSAQASVAQEPISALLEEIEKDLASRPPASVLRTAPVSTSPLDVDLSQVEEDAARQAEPPAALAAVGRKPVVPAMPNAPNAPASQVLAAPAAPVAVSRFSHAESTGDVRQDAEFYVSLGQYDEAIALLQDGLAGREAMNPLAWLDLLTVYHTLSRVEEYNGLRHRFNQRFCALVPPFAGFNKPGKGVEAYPAVIGRLLQAWGTPEVLQVFDAFLFRHVPGAAGEAFDLTAFKELLLLREIAAETLGLSPALPRPPAQTLDAAPVQPPGPDFLMMELDLPPVPAPAGADGASASVPGNLLDFDFYDAEAQAQALKQKSVAAKEAGA
ncbi:hypothetical protein PY257_04205 [Ramlibacter sp. H39-3-26]|uniref:type IV pilus assembly protein FimV n=1 Tax=Curvibacter soli TaxID=3031331 RepID=UPI0023DAE083|nr:hypothetical protein [Ramlibacter sp. H39-3-26]MDF1484389.1 hypothetical protein [Ramlibacter sp. H39-3-26]